MSAVLPGTEIHINEDAILLLYDGSLVVVREIRERYANDDQHQRHPTEYMLLVDPAREKDHSFPGPNFRYVNSKNVLAIVSPENIEMVSPERLKESGLCAEETLESEKDDRAWKYSEPELLKELYSYIEKTYGEHYGGSYDKLQALELIISEGHGTGFLIGDIIKYAARYGKKGETPKEWRKDLVKILHYGIVMLHVHDLENKHKN